jgi:IS30 family transposase
MPPIELAPVSGRYLSFSEREDIAVMRAEGISMRQIAIRIERSPSTISRELRRNAATRNGKLEYRASTAQWKADLAARRTQGSEIRRPGRSA